MARTADPHLAERWRARIRQQADSDLTIAQFCRRERLSTASFHAWKRRLRIQDLAARRPATPQPPAFLPVTLQVPLPASGQPPAIDAELPNGVRLRIPVADARLARQMIHALARARTDRGGQPC
jgi:hypothetical protein